MILSFTEGQAVPNPPTTAEAPAALKKQPGIDIRQQQPGTEIIVEADTGLYELVVVRPESGLVEVSGSDPRLRQPVLGQFLHSVNVLDPTAKFDHWIGRATKMVIAFRNAQFESGVVMAATIRCKGWHYDVF